MADLFSSLSVEEIDLLRRVRAAGGPGFTLLPKDIETARALYRKGLIQATTKAWTYSATLRGREIR